ncbi:MAG: hypothetical protein NC048_07735 [Bacteroides sp.]|nr:hypothetical protein [Ruminococcus flavefaciens]MCM1555370.1 hypothetical protein [Bacteroides sp.]
MQSPFADNDTALLCSEPAKAEYRGEIYSYTSYWYQCKKSGERFSTNESDALCTKQVHEQYRVRHHIPSVEEIVALRKRCKLSAAKMSALLGIGINQYRLYETGEMPSLSIGKILYALCHNPATLNLYLELFNPVGLDGRNRRVSVL